METEDTFRDALLQQNRDHCWLTMTSVHFDTTVTLNSIVTFVSNFE